MSEEEMKNEVASLLLEQRRLAVFGLKLGPKAFQRLKSLLLRLGYTRSVPMSRSPHVTRRLRYKAPLIVSYAKPPARPPHPDMPPQRTPTDLITHAAHALNNPTDSTVIRAFADHLMETHPDDPHAQAFIEWVNGGEWSGQRWKGAMYHPRGENLGSEGVATEPYFTLNPRRVITPGYAYKGDDSTQPLGLLAKRLNSPLWEFRSRMPRKTIASPLDGIEHSATAPARRIPKMTSTEVAQHLYDVDGVRGLAIAVIGARHFHPNVNPPTPNTYTPSRPKFTRRRVSVKFAKAETTRHPAHPLIAGFPLEHALRHLANDMNASSTLRDTAKHVLTTGDSSGLWGIHDLVQEHENADGTTGHPILKAGYNFMSAADKVQLDKHVHTALHEEGERRRRADGVGPNDEGVFYTPEHHGLVLSNFLGDTSKEHQDAMKRVRSRVYSLSGEKDPKKIDESLRRHGVRAQNVYRTRNNIDNTEENQRALNPPEGKSETATRYRRRYARLTVRPGEPLMGGSDFMHEVHDEGGNRVGHIWVSPQQNGTHLHVNHVGMLGHTPNSAGLDVVRQVRAQLKSHYPRAKTIGGTRISGAVRANMGKDRPTSRPLSRRVVKVRRYGQSSNYTHADFHRKIMENRDDTTPDLAYADWLQERGHEHTAAFIRHVVSQRGVPHVSGIHPAERYLFDNGSGESGFHRRHVSVGSVGWRGKGRGRPVQHGSVVHVNLPSDDNKHMEYVSQPMSQDEAWGWKKRLESESNGDSHKLMTSRRGVPIKYAKPNRSDFLDALRRMKSSNHTALTTAAVDVAGRMGMGDTKVLPALHDTPHGAVPGVAQAVYGQVRPETVHALAAWVNGLLPNGPGYAVFHPRPTGPDTLYRIRHEGSGMDLRVRLDRAGITSRVLVPHRKGFDILIPDKGNALAANVEAYSKQHGLAVEASPGHFQTVGSPDQGQARATMRNKVVQGEQQPPPSRMTRVSPPKKYAEVPTKEGEEWIKDFKVPVSYDSPNGSVGIAHYAPKRQPNGRWVWRQLEHLGHVRDHETAKEMFPNAMTENEFFDRHKKDEVMLHLTPEEVHLATDGREGTAPKALPTAQSHEDQGADANTGGVSYPEDFYALTRRRAVKYAKVPESEFGTLTPEQLAIATNAYENADHTGWGALGDHLAENGYPNAGNVLSRIGDRTPGTQYIAGGGPPREDMPIGGFRYAMVRDGADLVHRLVLRTDDSGASHVFTHRIRPEQQDRMSRRRRALTCR